MIEKVGHVKNPLTIIAIFAALAEVGGTIVLPLLQPVTQYIYVWFLIFFPIGLVGVFFYVLYNKHHVLYAPSDFQEDSSFKELLERQSPTQRIEILNQEVIAETKPESSTALEGTNEQDPGAISALRILQQDYRATYLLAEELAIAKLAKDRGWKIERALVSRGRGRTPFDGVAQTDVADYVIEVSYSRRNVLQSEIWRDKLRRIADFYGDLPDAKRNRFRTVVAFVYDQGDIEKVTRMIERIREMATEMPFHVEVVPMSYQSLTDEFRVH